MTEFKKTITRIEKITEKILCNKCEKDCTKYGKHAICYFDGEINDKDVWLEFHLCLDCWEIITKNLNIPPVNISEWAEK